MHEVYSEYMDLEVSVNYLQLSYSGRDFTYIYIYVASQSLIRLIGDGSRGILGPRTSEIPQPGLLRKTQNHGLKKMEHVVSD